MRTVRGTITVVQENRFKLAAEDGATLLFVLAHNAPLEAQELQALERSRKRVVVRCTDAPDLIAGVAHDVVLDPRP